jgi:hypothetical protein
MRARSDQDVTILPAACIPAGDDDRAGLTSPAATLHHTITGSCSHHEHGWGARRSPFGAVKFGYPRVQARAPGRSMKGRQAEVKETS